MMTIKNKADIAEIYISGDIIDDDEGSWIEEFRFGNTTGYEFPAKLKEQLDAVKDKPLEIHINSQGGSVFAGVAMANLIANHKPKTTAIVDGIAASIASQIFFSANECKIPSNAYVMIHRPFSLLEGNADDLRKAAEILDTLQEGLETTLRKKAREGVSNEDIHAMFNTETWLTGTETAEKFKVTLLDPLNVINCAASKRKMYFKNIPTNIKFFDTHLNSDDEEKIKIALIKADSLFYTKEK